MAELVTGLDEVTSCLPRVAQVTPLSCGALCLLCDISLQGMRCFIRWATSPNEMLHRVRRAVRKCIWSVAAVLPVEERATADEATRGTDTTRGPAATLGQTQSSDSSLATGGRDWGHEDHHTPVTLRTFGSDVLLLCEETFRQPLLPPREATMELLLDVLQSTPLRHAIVSSRPLVARLVHRLCRRFLLGSHNRALLCCSMYLLHCIFEEAAKTPWVLEQLRDVIASNGVDSSGQTTAGESAGQRDADAGMVTDLARRLRENRQERLVVSDILSVVHSFFAYATMQSTTSLRDCEIMFHEVLPVTSSPVEVNVALACSVARRVLARMRALGGAVAAACEDAQLFAEMSLSRATGISVMAILDLLEETALVDMGRLRHVGPHTDWSERLRLFAHATHLCPEAPEKILRGRYLRSLIASGLVPVAAVCDFVRCVLYPPLAGPRDAWRGDPNAPRNGAALAEAMHLARVVDLIELIAAVTAGDVERVAPEHVACVAGKLMEKLSVRVEGASAAQTAPLPQGPLLLLPSSLSGTVDGDTMPALLAAVAFLLPRTSALQPFALLALAELMQPEQFLPSMSCSARALVCIASQLISDWNGGTAVMVPELAQQLLQLVRGGLLDRLLAISADISGEHAVEVHGVAQYLPDMNDSRVCLLYGVGGMRRSERPEPHVRRNVASSLSAATSLADVIQLMHDRGVAALCRDVEPGEVHPSALLTGLIELGCAAPIPGKQLGNLVLHAYLCFGCAYEHAEEDEEVVSDSDSRESTSAPLHSAGRKLPSALAQHLGHFLRLCRAHLHWFGAAFHCASGELTAVLREGEEGIRADFVRLCTVRALRRTTQELLGSWDVCGCRVSDPLPLLWTVVKRLLHQPWAFSLCVHLCLVHVMSSVHDARATEGGSPLQILTTSASIDGGECFLRAVFLLIHHDTCVRVEGLAAPLLHLLLSWLKLAVSSMAPLSDGSQRPPGGIEAVVLGLLERHCMPLVWQQLKAFRESLSHRLGSPSLAALQCGEGSTRLADHDVAVALTHVVVRCLANLKPSDACRSDRPLVDWYAAGLLREWRDPCFLQLLCLLVERGSAGGLERQLPTRVATTPTSKTLLGVLTFLNTSAGTPHELASRWRHWHKVLPIAEVFTGSAPLARREEAGTVKKPMNRASSPIRLLIRACDFMFFPSASVDFADQRGGHEAVDTTTLDSMAPPAMVPDDEVRAAGCLVQLCMTLILSLSAALAPGGADAAAATLADRLCLASACRVMYFVLRMYRMILRESWDALGVLLACAENGPVLTRDARGWLLAGLLYLAPIASWANPMSRGPAPHPRPTPQTQDEARRKPSGKAARFAFEFLETLETTSRPARSEDQAALLPVNDGDEDQPGTREMLQALVSGCHFYNAQLPADAAQFPLHRATDFFLGSRAASPAGAADRGTRYFLVHNAVNVDLTSF